MTNTELIKKMIKEAATTYPDWNNYAQIQQKEIIQRKVKKYLDNIRISENKKRGIK